MHRKSVPEDSPETERPIAVWRAPAQSQEVEQQQHSELLACSAEAQLQQEESEQREERNQHRQDETEELRQEWEAAEQRSRERREEEQRWYREQDEKDDHLWERDASGEDSGDDMDCEDEENISKYIFIK